MLPKAAKSCQKLLTVVNRCQTLPKVAKPQLGYGRTNMRPHKGTCGLLELLSQLIKGLIKSRLLSVPIMPCECPNCKDFWWRSWNDGRFVWHIWFQQKLKRKLASAGKKPPPRKFAKRKKLSNKNEKSAILFWLKVKVNIKEMGMSFWAERYLKPL